jgi:hypothetical protein
VIDRAWFDLVVFVAAIAAGGIAAVTGFGIGSLLTPTLALLVGTRVAVAAVAVPHVIGTALRFAKLRQDVDRRTLITFGMASAAGGLTGALLHGWVSAPWLGIVFGVLLLLVAASEMSGLSRVMRFTGATAWIAGTLSGLLGGLVGNQGGIRSAALFGFDLPKRAFVATATAIGLIVDGARLPVYLATDGGAVAQILPVVGTATTGVVIGTLFGARVLASIPEAIFRRVVAVILALLGGAMLITSAASR